MILILSNIILILLIGQFTCQYKVTYYKMFTYKTSRENIHLNKTIKYYKIKYKLLSTVTLNTLRAAMADFIV